VIGLEKHINRAEEKSALSRWSSGLVAVALGFLLEITLLEGNPNLIYRLRYNIARVWINLNWLHMVLGILLGIPYTTVFLADMVDQRRIRDCDDNSFVDGRMEKKSKRFLPNPTLLIAVLLGTVFVTALDLIAGPVSFGKYYSTLPLTPFSGLISATASTAPSNFNETLTPAFFRKMYLVHVRNKLGIGRGHHLDSPC